MKPVHERWNSFRKQTRMEGPNQWLHIRGPASVSVVYVRMHRLQICSQDHHKQDIQKMFLQPRPHHRFDLVRLTVISRCPRLSPICCCVEKEASKVLFQKTYGPRH